MAKVTYTGANAVKLKKPKYIVGTLFASTDTDTLSGDSFVFEDIERDTTKISQDENDSSDIERETSDTPIDSIVTLGAWQVEAELDDVNADLLVALMGFSKNADGTEYYAPSSYSDRYIRFEVVYEDPADSSKYIAMRVPKLKLNARVVLESMNSNLGNITIAGTAQNIKVTDSSGKEIDTPFVYVKNYTLPTGE